MSHGTATHHHPYVKIKHLPEVIPTLIQAAEALTGHETSFGFRHRVKVWESDVPNRVEAKLLFTKSFIDEGETLGYRLYGVARARTDLWDILTAFRTELGDPSHFELTHHEMMESLHPFRYEDDWLGFQAWWVIPDLDEVRTANA